MSDVVFLLAGLDLALVAALLMTASRRRSNAAAAADLSPSEPLGSASPLDEDVAARERLLGMVEARLGPDHPEVGSLCEHLARLYIAAAEYDKAEVALERAVEIMERSLGADALSLASLLDELATLDEKIGRHEAAAERWRKALELRGRRLAQAHPDVVWTAMRLGRALCRRENYVAATDLLDPFAAAALPPSDDAVLALSTLAVALAEQGKDEDADEIVDRATAMVEAITERGVTADLWSELDVAAAPSAAASVPTTTVVEPTIAMHPPADAEDMIRALTAAAGRVLVTSAERASRRLLATSQLLVPGRDQAVDLARRITARVRALGVHLTPRAPHGTRISPAVRATSLAQRRLSDAQRQILLALGGALVVLGALAPIPTAQMLIAVITVLYLAALAFRVRAFWRGLQSPRSIVISDEVARSVADEDLPIYTILVPAYHEPEVIGRLVTSLADLEYPPDRLDIKILLEADDAVTLQAARAAAPPAHITIVRVPVSQPRTKPKALNYGLETARGQLVTIYDAEDRPEPLQLRRAVVAFGILPRRVVCLQAKLSYHNAEQNLLTRWFTAEYATWFSHLLPGLAERRMPLPLGGTSNHFRLAALKSVGAWDPYNVTEDADLGIRLYRAGFAVEVLESTTLEEANSDFINWTKQRSRWYKGYIQTWLVHMRDPLRLWHELGPKGFLSFNLFVGGTPLLTLVSPIFWVLTALWFVTHWTIIPVLFSGWLYYVGLFSLVVGNVSFLYMGVISSRATGRPELVPAMLVAPLYWAMMSIAAIKALVQLMAAPSFWEKTTHGLDRVTNLGEKRGAA
jgi:cellulose synthase/poly-beta-1,6-N-acetylglucosamine synthase-like glycosyltransferase/tetratricopeptide (TPR) repeat protein